MFRLELEPELRVVKGVARGVPYDVQGLAGMSKSYISGAVSRMLSRSPESRQDMAVRNECTDRAGSLSEKPGRMYVSEYISGGPQPVEVEVLGTQGLAPAGGFPDLPDMALEDWAKGGPPSPGLMPGPGNLLKVALAAADVSRRE